MKVKVPTTAFDPASVLETDEDALVYLNDAFDSGDHKVIAAAIGDIARARGASALSRAVDVSRASLYSSLSEKGNPTLSLLMSVLGELGLELEVKKRAA